MKPILFNTPMVQDILAGRKTVTRMAIKDMDIINGWDCEADGTPIAYIDQATGDSYPSTAPAPYQPGDILWVRETFFEYNGRYYYKADGKHNALDSLVGGSFFKWRPSIHMPREAARLFLRVTDVRVERLQDINLDPPGPKNQVVREGLRYLSDFIAVWDRTIKPADLHLYGWEANPWCWVIAFERVSREKALGGGGDADTL
ncbi:hypothetical protein [Intestinimonas butyriciproducens]|uniref:hypothetical protein n=1 Tax=Intestinimonas butyriciproducens TaxID=1297617 RepID=UPI001FAE1523|nr:hypothetical protein [Intestinimonas butyriciproducens]